MTIVTDVNNICHYQILSKPLAWLFSNNDWSPATNVINNLDSYERTLFERLKITDNNRRYVQLKHEAMNITFYRDDSSNEVIQEFLESVLDLELKYLASDLTSYGFSRSNDLAEAVERAISICRTAEVSIRENFKPVYICGNGQLICDWRISELAQKLIILNANPCNPLVANFQLQMIRSRNNHG